MVFFSNSVLSFHDCFPGQFWLPSRHFSHSVSVLSHLPHSLVVSPWQSSCPCWTCLFFFMLFPVCWLHLEDTCPADRCLCSCWSQACAGTSPALPTICYLRSWHAVLASAVLFHFPLLADPQVHHLSLPTGYRVSSRWRERGSEDPFSLMLHIRPCFCLTSQLFFCSSLLLLWKCFFSLRLVPSPGLGSASSSAFSWTWFFSVQTCFSLCFSFTYSWVWLCVHSHVTHRYAGTDADLCTYKKPSHDPVSLFSY